MTGGVSRWEKVSATLMLFMNIKNGRLLILKPPVHLVHIVIAMDSILALSVQTHYRLWL